MAVVPVSATTTVSKPDEAEVVLCSILYPVTVAPPSELGADQERATCWEPALAAATDWGTEGEVVTVTSSGSMDTPLKLLSLEVAENVIVHVPARPVVVRLKSLAELAPDSYGKLCRWQYSHALTTS